MGDKFVNYCVISNARSLSKLHSHTDIYSYDARCGDDAAVHRWLIWVGPPQRPLMWVHGSG